MAGHGMAWQAESAAAAAGAPSCPLPASLERALPSLAKLGQFELPECGWFCPPAPSQGWHSGAQYPSSIQVLQGTNWELMGDGAECQNRQ